MEDSAKKEEKVAVKMRMFTLISTAMLLGCSSGCDSNDSGDSTPTDTAITDTSDTSSSATEELGSLLITYEFAGFSDDWRRCVDTNFTQLYLELFLDGESQQVSNYPCDDSDISVKGLPFGSWKMSLRTIENVDSATEPYGMSSSFMTFIGSSDVMEPHLLIQCQGC
jgi:hypothetical protein